MTPIHIITPPPFKDNDVHSMLLFFVFGTLYTYKRASYNPSRYIPIMVSRCLVGRLSCQLNQASFFKRILREITNNRGMMDNSNSIDDHKDAHLVAMIGQYPPLTARM